MGLAERRASKEFQDKHFPELKSEIHALAGFPVPIEVHWEQLAVEGQSDYYKEAWSEIFFKPIIEALREIGRDDMGKEALKIGLKKIELRNREDNSSPSSAISFQSGELVIDHKLSNIDATRDRTKHLVDIMQKDL
jgi:hypothetical protein